MTAKFSVSLLGTQSDERLSSLASAGQERAFEAIVERYRKPLMRYAMRFIGEARAEEVVQTAFLSAWSALTSGTEVRDLRPWLYRIVHNGALNAMQRAESSDTELIEAADGTMGPDAIFEQSEAVREALGMIAELPERQRAALLAVAVDGRAHSDVALDLGVSDAGVRQLVRRARVQLRTAATALTPMPLAIWLADGQRGAIAHADVSHRIAEILGDGGGNALANSAIKAGAVVVSVTAVAAAAPRVSHVIDQPSRADSPAKAIGSASNAAASTAGFAGTSGMALAAKPVAGKQQGTGDNRKGPKEFTFAPARGGAKRGGGNPESTTPSENGDSGQTQPGGGGGKGQRGNGGNGGGLGGGQRTRGDGFGGGGGKGLGGGQRTRGDGLGGGGGRGLGGGQRGNGGGGQRTNGGGNGGGGQRTNGRGKTQRDFADSFSDE